MVNEVKLGDTELCAADLGAKKSSIGCFASEIIIHGVIKCQRLHCEVKSKPANAMNRN